MGRNLQGLKEAWGSKQKDGSILLDLLDKRDENDKRWVNRFEKILISKDSEITLTCNSFITNAYAHAYATSHAKTWHLLKKNCLENSV